MRATLAQLNPVVGDIEGNVARMAQVLAGCRSSDAQLVVFTELFLVGYPPRDLLERAAVIERSLQAVEEIKRLSRQYPGTAIIFGAPLPSASKVGKGLHNSAVVVVDGEIRCAGHKSLLPTYDVFDEARYFDPVKEKPVFEFNNIRFGISICEDAWNDPTLWPRPLYDYDPIAALAASGADVILNIAASPFHRGKDGLRYRLASNHARSHSIPFVFVNQVGGNDELIFDGRSMVVDRRGELVAALPGFREAVETVDLFSPGSGSYAAASEIASVHDALVLGVRDYLRKCGFHSAVLGVSGGIDSAVTLCIACEALGQENVVAVSMPGPYSSAASVTDAEALAANLGVRLLRIPINSVYDSYLATLAEVFTGTAADVTEENVQARIRGNILMALANKFGYLPLATGNKSELAVGYCTLYGDMSGGLAVIADVPKTMVYELAAYINRHREIIPAAIIHKAPSAELRPGQTDQDSLPPYEVLDAILAGYVDRGMSAWQLVQEGFDPETVRWVIEAINRSEYKRRQAPPGLKVTSKAFGTGRRMPIAARFLA